jgi:hypothetical protein
MNTNEFKDQLNKKYGFDYSKADVLEALGAFNPFYLFDMLVESGLKAMIADIQEFVACYMMEEQEKDHLSLRSVGEAVPKLEIATCQGHSQ